MGNTIRSKLRIRTLIALAIICALIFPAVVFENQQIPKSNENLFFLGYFGQPDHLGEDITNHDWSYVLLNHQLNTVGNTSVTVMVEVDTNNTAKRLEIVSETNSRGILNISYGELCSGFYAAYGYRATIIYYYILNYTVSKNAFRGDFIPKYDVFNFQKYVVKTSHANNTTIFTGSLPTVKLGYYGYTPVFYMEQGSDVSTINISYRLYNPEDKTVSYPITNLTLLKSGKVYVLRNYTLLKRFNEALNVSFYVNRNVKINTLFGNISSVVSSPISYTDFPIFPPSEIVILISILMVFLIYMPMYNENVYRRYLTLPEKRRTTVLTQIGSSLVICNITTMLTLGISFVIAYFSLNVILSPQSMLFTLFITDVSFFLFSSIYSLIGSYFIGRTRPRMFITILMSIGYLILPFIAAEKIILSPAISHYPNGVTNPTFLYKPVLTAIRTYNLITSITPGTNINALNRFLLREPFQFIAGRIVMYNHLNLFDLSMILPLLSIIIFSTFCIFLSVRKLNKI